MREVAAEFERPALLFSGGKDSICLLRLAEKAFRPSDIPMPFLNVDTGHHFPELNEFRDRRAKELGASSSSARSRTPSRRASPCRSRRDQPQPSADSHAARGDRGIPLRLLHRRRAARRGKGARQGTLLQLPRLLRPVGSEEPAPGNLESLQRPRESRRKHARLSAPNWTEMDVWEYIRGETRSADDLFQPQARNASAAAASGCPSPTSCRPKPGEEVNELVVRVRTIGDIISTGWSNRPPTLWMTSSPKSPPPA